MSSSVHKQTEGDPQNNLTSQGIIWSPSTILCRPKTCCSVKSNRTRQYRPRTQWSSPLAAPPRIRCVTHSQPALVTASTTSGEHLTAGKTTRDIVQMLNVHSRFQHWLQMLSRSCGGSSSSQMDSFLELELVQQIVRLQLCDVTRNGCSWLLWGSRRILQHPTFSFRCDHSCLQCLPPCGKFSLRFWMPRDAAHSHPHAELTPTWCGSQLELHQKGATHLHRPPTSDIFKDVPAPFVMFERRAKEEQKKTKKTTKNKRKQRKQRRTEENEGHLAMSRSLTNLVPASRHTLPRQRPFLPTLLRQGTHHPHSSIAREWRDAIGNNKMPNGWASKRT